MIRTFKFLVIPVLLAASVACDPQDTSEALPPPTGPESPVGPQIPNVTQADQVESANSAVDYFVGTLHTKTSADIATKVTGTITSMEVEEGDTVRKGQVLFRLDRRQAQLAVNQAKAGVAAAQSMLATATRELARVEALASRGSAPPATLDNARSSRDSAAIGVDQAKIALDLARRSLADMTMTAPIAGTVTAKYKNTGETVTSMPPTVVLTIQDQSTLELRVHLPERELRSLRQDSTLKANFPAVGVEKEVTVARIGSVVNPRTRTVEVFASVPNQEDLLRPGMSADVRLPQTPSAPASEGSPEVPSTGASAGAASAEVTEPKAAEPATADQLLVERNAEKVEG